MGMLKREINLLLSNSFFLFGARGTGKTSLLRDAVFAGKNVMYIDLLEFASRDRFERDPDVLEQILRAHSPLPEWVIIDEIQRVPALLDTVHRLIESELGRSGGVKFALTGSSARKLKAGGANLLAGRAFVYELFPLTCTEIGSHLTVEEVTNWGSLPKLVSFSSHEERRAYLETYALTYLKEEIWEEHLVRDLNPFRKFLQVASQCSGEIVNYQRVAHDVGVDNTTVQRYYQILEDTLLSIVLEPYHRSVRKRQRVNPKIYLFDNGVKRALDGSLRAPFPQGSGDFGKLFEHLVVQEFTRRNRYKRQDYAAYYLTTGDDAEIDLIIERDKRTVALVEIKSSTQVLPHHVRHLKSFEPALFPGAVRYVWSLDTVKRQIDDVTLVPWQVGLEELGL